MIDYRLYLVTDDPSRYAGNWLDNVVAAVEGGVTCVQYRDTESPRRIQYERILRLRDALGKTPIIVNNDAELAAAVKAEGVHVGQRDMSVDEVRKLVGPSCEIGLSITELFQLSALCTPHAAPRTASPDCLGIGPVFDARKTKVDASAAIGVSGLQEIMESLRNHSPFPLPHSPFPVPHSPFPLPHSPFPLPHSPFPLPHSPFPLPHSPFPVPHSLSTVAIGGITLDNAAEVLATGVGGVAVVSAFSKSPDPFSVAKTFRKLF